MYIDSDKSACQIKREQLVKQIRKTCQMLYPAKRFHADRAKGIVSVGWKPIIKVEPNPNELPPTVEWSAENIVAEGIDKTRVTDAIAEFVSGPPPVQWS
eukprot:6804276-Pyramimonas_sp.AAC.1